MQSFQLYRHALRHCSPLPPAEERRLARRYVEGDQDAGRRLVEACLPFVISIAREYRRSGVLFEDLVQQGNLGLLKALDRFDPERDCRLVTYAATWIRGEIREYVTRTSRIVRLGSTHTERVAVRIWKHGGIASAEELAERSGMPLPRAQQLFALLSRSEISLDAGPGEGSYAPLERLAARAPSPEDEVATHERDAALREMVERVLPGLGERERRILEARWLADEPSTLDDLGREMGVSRERVRQLEARARERLRRALEPLVAA